MSYNVNGNICENSHSAGEFRKDSEGDSMAFSEDITVTKTEVKEECCDYDMSVDDIEFVNIKEEYISSTHNNFKTENFEPMKDTSQSSNENVDVGKEEFREADIQTNKYRCELCQCDFDEEIYLGNHVEHCPFAIQKLSKEHACVKDNDKIYRCAHCTFSTSIRSRLVNHVRIHAKDKPFKCTYKKCKCTPEQEESCKCDMCGYATTTKGILNQHILVRHSGKPKKYKCQDCEYATHIKESLVLHSRIHVNDKPFQCTYKDCRCTPGQEEICECNMCGYAATQRSHLRRHVLVKHSGESKKHKCKDCSYATHTKKSLVLHIRIHNNEKPFRCTYKNCRCAPGQEGFCNCDMCGYAGTEKHRLKMHILLKHSTEQKKYKCKDCNYAAHTKKNLVQHCRNHTGDKPLTCTYKNCRCAPDQKESCECDMCEFATSEKSNLKRHVLRKHSGEGKKYKCKDCEYASHAKNSLVLHSRTHTNEKPFRCTYKNCTCAPEQTEFCKCGTCEYAATEKYSLKTHILVKHSDEPKRYKCTDCKYATHTRTLLKQHIRIHSKDREFKHIC